MLIMELPPYKRPLLRIVLRHMWDRSRLFLRRAGTVILGINIVLWFLATYPRSDQVEKNFAREKQAAIAHFFPAVGTNAWNESEMYAQLAAATAKPGAETNSPAEFGLSITLEQLAGRAAGEKLRHSFAGMAGRTIEPIVAPLGFDWKMGIGIVAEVFNSTMSIVYNVGKYDPSEKGIKGLAESLQQQRKADGTPVYTALTAVSLMVFYVFALQCVSTVAIVRRETNSWRWPLFQWLYMGALAWLLAFLTYQGGRILGFN
jgi:ferrous iron transport protein B